MSEPDYSSAVRSWVPVPGTTTGRLVEAALSLFGAEGFQAVGVGALAARAGVTTGALYHHFGSKAGLYVAVRADVERRVLDRLEGAAALREIRTVADLAPVVLVGVDYLVGAGYARLLAEPAPDEVPDEVERFFDALLPDPAAPVGALLAAAWRITLSRAASGDVTARASLERLLLGRPPGHEPEEQHQRDHDAHRADTRDDPAEQPEVRLLQRPRRQRDREPGQ